MASSTISSYLARKSSLACTGWEACATN
jgi:hypothetical protein